MIPHNETYLWSLLEQGANGGESWLATLLTRYQKSLEARLPREGDEDAFYHRRGDENSSSGPGATGVRSDRQSVDALWPDGVAFGELQPWAVRLWVRENMRLASNGDVSAQMVLADYFALAGWEEEDEEEPEAVCLPERFRWLHRAATSGHPQARTDLAEVYDTGLKHTLFDSSVTGLPEDLRAVAETGPFYRRIACDEFIREEKQQRDYWLEKSVAQQHPPAFVMKGRLCENRADYKTAGEWYERAANREYYPAFERLARLQKTGAYNVKEGAWLLEHLRLIAQHDQETQQSKLLNLGITMRCARHFYWAGTAKSDLAELLVLGVCGARNEGEARAWAIAAGDQGSSEAKRIAATTGLDVAKLCKAFQNGAHEGLLAECTRQNVLAAMGSEGAVIESSTILAALLTAINTARPPALEQQSNSPWWKRLAAVIKGM